MLLRPPINLLRTSLLLTRVLHSSIAALAPTAQAHTDAKRMQLAFTRMATALAMALVLSALSSLSPCFLIS
jgi:hypothetical protein